MAAPLRRTFALLATLLLAPGFAGAQPPETSPESPKTSQPPAEPAPRPTPLAQRGPKAASGPAKPADAEAAAADPLHGLEYRLVGPGAGGRVSEVTGVPGDPLTYYAATAAGGVWKSGDGGASWDPIFDEEPTQSIGSIAVAPSDANVLYVGTGEANVRGNTGPGDGIYRSTDAGATWRHVWTQVGQIGRIVVHPTNPDVAFAAVLGHAFGPNPERGVYRTTDGGTSWQRVLFVDPDTGASDVTFDPGNPRILYAGLWQMRRFPWGLTSGGPGSGLYTSRDGGDTWQELTGSGLPDKPWGKVGVRVAPSDSGRIYALIEAEDGGLFRSDDGGKSWALVNPSRGLRQRAWYYTALTVDPWNADVVWFPEVGMLKTIDGGSTVRAVKGGGWDYHEVWINPDDTSRMIVASDAGISLTRDGGDTWHRPPVPIAQLYHVDADSRTPYRVMGSLQDYGTASGPSNSLHGGGIYLSDWHGVGGGEAGHVVADPEDPDVVYAGEYLGYLSHFDEATGQARNVSIYPWNGSGHGAADLEYRFQWTAPILVSPHDHRVVYHAANVLFRSTDAGQHWQAVSPDLTRNDKAKQSWAGGPITGDNTGVEFYDTIFALAESPVQAGVIWAGSDDGLVHVTRDDGATWTDVTKNLHGLPEWGTVASIEASPFDAGTAYVVVDAHRLDDLRPYLWKTTDYGATWKSLAAGLSADVHLHVVREDPKVEGLLYLGTEHGLRYSPDRGATWKSLQLNLPAVAVSDLKVHGDDLVVATRGRSIWILDDLTPVRRMTPEIAAQAVHLFPSAQAVRWRYREVLGDADGAGDNPPQGAILTYSLGKDPEGEIKLEVMDSQGRLVRTLESTPAPRPIGPDHPDWDPDTEIEPALSTDIGINRASWDLAWDGAGFIPGGMIDWGDPTSGPLALPGDYTLRLTVDGETASTTLRVLPDPRVQVSPADLQAELDFALGLRADLRRVIAAVGRIRSLRDQVEARDKLLEDDSAAAPLVEMGKALVAKLDELAETLYSPDAEVTYDILAGRHGGAKLYSQLSPLFTFVNDADGAPTQGMREVAAGLEERLAAREADLQALIDGDLARLDAEAKELGIAYVIAPTRGE